MRSIFVDGSGKRKYNMKSKIKVGIVGYGHLGKGAVLSIAHQEDMELVAIFTRREPHQFQAEVPVYSYQSIPDFKEKIDVMLLCGGSAHDLPVQSVEMAQYFHTVDSFDNHAEIPAYFEKLDQKAKAHQRLSLISTGWDPGLFSMIRVLGESLLPQGKTYTFWGEGLSQGHSDAVRRVSGVKYAAQYTIPDESALDQVRAGEQPHFNAPQMHKRICYVVLAENADADQVEKDIKTMPNYFEPYDTEVHFIDEAEFKANHQGMPHGGKVLRSGFSSEGVHQLIEFNLSLDSNPEFTSSVLVAYVRAVYKMAQEGKVGAISVLDVPIGYLSPEPPEELRRRLL